MRVFVIRGNGKQKWVSAWKKDGEIWKKLKLIGFQVSYWYIFSANIGPLENY